MDPLTVDMVVDAAPDELIQRAYHYGIPVSQLAEGVAEFVRSPTPRGPLYVPAEWEHLVAA